MNAEQLERVGRGDGFIAALDQSGGSTPGALERYGISPDSYSGEDEMFDLVHEMRSRIMTAPAFNGDKVFGAILFEATMDREVEGVPTAKYLWETKRVVPFLKTDKGLAEVQDGVKLMNPFPGLVELCERGREAGIFGTKMRSVIDEANEKGIKANVGQQFDWALDILGAGLMPIVEPEVSIGSASKAEAEVMMRDEIISNLDRLGDGQQVMLKLTLPDEPGLFTPLVQDPRVLRVVALSGGYSREEANAKLAQNAGVVASFSRALLEGLSASQSDEEFNSMLAASIDETYQASVAG